MVHWWLLVHCGPRRGEGRRMFSSTPETSHLTLVPAQTGPCEHSKALTFGTGICGCTDQWPSGHHEMAPRFGERFCVCVCVRALAANGSSKQSFPVVFVFPCVCAREAERAELRAGIDSILRKVSSFFLLFSGLVHECRLTRKPCVRFLFLRIDQIHFFICLKRWLT